MARKRDLIRAYAPDLCARDTLAHRLDCSIDRIDKLVEQQSLPQPLMIGALKRWDWLEVVEWIKARNGKLEDFAEQPNGSVFRIGDEDPFSAGVARVKAANG